MQENEARILPRLCLLLIVIKQNMKVNDLKTDITWVQASKKSYCNETIKQ